MVYDLNTAEKKLLQAYHMKTLLLQYEGQDWDEARKRRVNFHISALAKLGITITIREDKTFNISGH